MSYQKATPHSNLGDGLMDHSIIEALAASNFT